MPARRSAGSWRTGASAHRHGARHEAGREQLQPSGGRRPPRQKRTGRRCRRAGHGRPIEQQAQTEPRTPAGVTITMAWLTTRLPPMPSSAGARHRFLEREIYVKYRLLVAYVQHGRRPARSLRRRPARSHHTARRAPGARARLRAAGSRRRPAYLQPSLQPSPGPATADQPRSCVAAAPAASLHRPPAAAPLAHLCGEQPRGQQPHKPRPDRGCARGRAEGSRGSPQTPGRRRACRARRRRRGSAVVISPGQAAEGEARKPSPGTRPQLCNASRSVTGARGRPSPGRRGRRRPRG